MRKVVVIFSLLFGFVWSVYGQNVVVPADTISAQVENREYILVALHGKIISSDSLNVAMSHYISANQKRNVNIYRLRIYFDNKQNARSVSEQIALEFSEAYPEIPVFRGYVNPYFKVTVGNFRTKSEAMKFLNEIKGKYPSVFLVKEAFSTI